jgi:hypothetical protein
MLLAYLRLGFLITSLVASLHVAAVPRFWTLTGVRFNDGTLATGYFNYDDATQMISRWNVHVEYFPFSVYFLPFTYVPGNSTMEVSQPSGAAAPSLSFSAAIGVPGEFFGLRHLQITPLAALDGRNPVISLETSVSKEEIPTFGPERVRAITAGSLVLTPVPPAVVIVQVDEFYDAALRHYFITADGAEKQALDTGVFPGWERTGESFKAYAKGSSTGDSIAPVCRYYSPAIIENDVEFTPGLDSHFFSADPGECLSVFRHYDVFWSLESDNAFQINLPDKTNGACPVGTLPVYRLWNQRDNHRYTINVAIKEQMLAVGYLVEGYGTDGVVMCALQ